MKYVKNSYQFPSKIFYTFFFYILNTHYIFSVKIAGNNLKKISNLTMKKKIIKMRFKPKIAIVCRRKIIKGLKQTIEIASVEYLQTKTPILKIESLSRGPRRLGPPAKSKNRCEDTLPPDKIHFSPFTLFFFLLYISHNAYKKLCITLHCSDFSER